MMEGYEHDTWESKEGADIHDDTDCRVCEIDRLRAEVERLSGEDGMTLQRSEASLCPTCGELMDGIVHGKSQCNLPTFLPAVQIGVTWLNHRHNMEGAEGSKNCAACEIDRLRAEVERLTLALKRSTDFVKPVVEALTCERDEARG